MRMYGIRRRPGRRRPFKVRWQAAGRGPVFSNINFSGVINVDIEAGLAKLTGGWPPLRPAQLGL